MFLADITKQANKEIELLRPYCRRIEIAGSIRRKRPDCKDIEIVAIPDSYKLEEFFIVHRHTFAKNGGKYKQYRNAQGTAVDLFLCTPETWAMVYLIRTGSADFSHRFMIELRKRSFCCKDNVICTLPDMVPVERKFETEADIVNFVGMEYIEPEQRSV